MVKHVKAADLGGAAPDQHGQIEGTSNAAWVVAAVPPQGGKLYISLHTTEGGARARLSKVADEWGVSLDEVSADVQPCEVETP